MAHKEKVVLTLTPEQFSALKATLVWAELYDIEKNEDKNKQTFEKIRAFDYTKEA